MDFIKIFVSPDTLLDMDVYGCLTIDVYGRLVAYEADVLGVACYGVIFFLMERG